MRVTQMPFIPLPSIRANGGLSVIWFNSGSPTISERPREVNRDARNMDRSNQSRSR
jgi:hypothetical protein